MLWGSYSRARSGLSFAISPRSVLRFHERLYWYSGGLEAELELGYHFVQEHSQLGMAVEAYHLIHLVVENRASLAEHLLLLRADFVV